MSVLLLLAAGLCGGDASVRGGPAAVDLPPSVRDIDGHEHALAGEADSRPAVFVFVKTACPIANYYQPTLRRLANTWGEDVRLFVVHTESRVTAAKARDHRDEFDVPGVVLLDPAGNLIERLDARVTPEAFVVDAEDRLRYRGRIDDTYLGFGRRRQVVGSHDLDNAVTAVLEGRRVPVPQADPVGCRIRRRADAAAL